MFSSFTSWSFRRSPGCLSEQRRRTSKGGGGLKNLPQFRLLQSRPGPTQEAADRARPNPHTHNPTPGEGGGQEHSYFTSALPLPGEGQETPRYIHNFPRSELMRGWSRGQVHPQSDTTGAPEALRSCAWSPLPSFTSLSSVLFLTDIHLPGSFEIKPSHSNESLTMRGKKVAFPFFLAAGGPTPRDDSAQSDRRENALPGSQVPPPSTTPTGRWGGIVASCGTARPSCAETM